MSNIEIRLIDVKTNECISSGEVFSRVPCIGEHVLFEYGEYCVVKVVHKNPELCYQDVYIEGWRV